MQFLGRTTEGFTESLIIPLSDEVTDISVAGGVYNFFLPYTCTIDSIRISLNGQCSGTDVIVDVNADGTSLFTNTRVHLPAGNNVSLVQPDFEQDTKLDAFTRIDFDIDQVGSVVSGYGLKAMIILHKSTDIES